MADSDVRILRQHAVSSQLSTAPAPGVSRPELLKLEGAFSFDTPLSTGGLYSSLKTWRSFAHDHVMMLDAKKNRHTFYLHQKWSRTLKEEEEQQNGDVKMEDVGDTLASKNPTKALPTTMGINTPNGFQIRTDKDLYDEEKVLQVMLVRDSDENLSSCLRCSYPTGIELIDRSVNAFLNYIEDASHKMDLQSAASSAAWQEERIKSKFAANLIQIDPQGKKISPNPKDWFCEECGEQENLWLNLSDGYIGGGRRNWDGSGGCGAALRHYEQTGSIYPLAVKLGTITPHSADVYSYAPDEDDMVEDEQLIHHLEHWGIKMQSMQKTDKTMTELQIDLNRTYEFERMTEAGKDLQRVSGSGLIGIDNLGNSCYMNSVLQLLCSIPVFAELFLFNSDIIFQSATLQVEKDMLTQLAKIVIGLCTDRYAVPGVPSDLKHLPSQDKSKDHDRLVRSAQLNVDRIRPHLFKALIGEGNQFSSPEQQDALEYFQFLIEKISREIHAASRSQRVQINDPIHSFSFALEERLQCTGSGCVKFLERSDNVLSLDIPLEAATNREQVEIYERKKLERKRPRDDDSAASVDRTEDEPVRLSIPFDACISKFMAPEIIEGFYSSAMKARGNARKTVFMKTMPDYLVLHLRRYFVDSDWTVKKLDASVRIPLELDLECLRPLNGGGPQPGEQLLPEEERERNVGAPVAVQSNSTGTAHPVPDPVIVAALMEMGFSEHGSKRAAIASKNTSTEASMQWVFEHMEDPDFNDPLPEQHASLTTTGATSATLNADDVNMLATMGFTERQAKAALQACDKILERAADWLFSHSDDLESAVAQIESQASASSGDTSAASGSNKLFHDGVGRYELIGMISHMGSNTSSGHYVAHLRREGKWILFNDEKVAVSENPPFDAGYMYLFRRKQ